MSISSPQYPSVPAKRKPPAPRPKLRAAQPLPPRLAPISTMLQPGERSPVDAAGEGVFYTLHRDSLDDVLRDLRERRATGVLLSVGCCGRGDQVRMAGLVREFPRIPAVALLTRLDPTTPQVVLSLGQSGVHTLVDVRNSSGWRELREVMARERADAVEARVMARITDDIAGAPADCLAFFGALFNAGSRPGTVRALSRDLGVLPSTLMSRFFRAKLPPPKKYLALGRLTRAAFLFENPGLSVAAVANSLEYSSPQSFGRHVRTLLGLTAVQFRERYDGEGMAQRFRDELVLPYRKQLCAFAPLTALPGWVSGWRAERGAEAEAERLH